MQVNVENISPVLVEFNIEIDAERVTSEYNKVFTQITKQSRIKGFRPGKAPKNIVKRVYGSRVEADVEFSQCYRRKRASDGQSAPG